MNNRLHIFFLFMAALLWGTTFVAQDIGADYVGPWTYLACRSWVAVLFLTPVVHIMDRIADAHGVDNRRPRTPEEKKALVVAGIISGIMLGAASVTQQIGIAYTTASKAGFITALYVVIVPLLSIFVGKKPAPKIWLCTLLGVVGMYLLCMTADRFRLEVGDAWELGCAFLFAVEIMVLDHYCPLVDAVRMNRMQFLVIAVLSTAVMIPAEHPTPEVLRLGLPAMLYAGIISNGIAYTFQMFGQPGVNPALASLVMSLESVFAALSGWIVLHQRFSPRELCGCVLMFLAILLSQVDIRPRRKRAE